MRFTRSAVTEDLKTATPLADPASDQGLHGDLQEQVIEVLRTIYDPEIPVNIYELGLVYNVDVDPGKFVDIKMTLTSPACPVAGSLPGEVEQKAASVQGVSGAKVELVWNHRGTCPRCRKPQSFS